MTRLSPLLFALLPALAAAQVTFDFETTGLGDHPAVSGDLTSFVETTDQALTGTHSLRFDAAAPIPFRAFTYDLPIALETGTITAWFYDTVGAGTGSTFQWRLSILLEDANNVADFGAVEIADLPYGGFSYYGSEGVTDRLAAPDLFESGTFGARSVGWHRVDFNVTPTITTISVDGNTGVQVAAPGSSGTDLRLRFMADSASVGGSGNWTLSSTGYPAAPALVYIDDVSFSATAPAIASAALSFEDGTWTGSAWSPAPEYDAPEQFMVSDAHNEPRMRDFVGTFSVSAAHAHAGTKSAVFAAGEPTYKNVVVDLSTATPGTITINFHDAVGADALFDKVGGAVIIEDGTNPANFIAAEIWNAPYPGGPGAPNNYYLTTRPAAFGSGFHSNYFGGRTTGWHTLTITLTNTTSQILIDGAGADAGNGGAVYTGPGLNASPRLRIMADSPTMGGFRNWQDGASWDHADARELNTLTLTKGATYLHLDDITLPIPAASAVSNWLLY